ncbi:hypothetical protein BASA81_011254 [Batrachochytrium salamandrivorans]|nr:hypothetical protein BASA81_011254 [Batrachochytrium salamandrivorans]
MSVQQVLRSVTTEDLMAMELEELEALLQRGNSAFAAKAKQTVQDCKNEVSTMEQERQEEVLSMEQQRQTLLEFEPKVLKCFASNPVKLNVGGSYFSTSVENLTREPDTFFAVMFSGRWDVKINPKDDAVFVDRSPLVFEFIIDYLRTGDIDLDDLSPKQLNALNKEADFYQIASLLELLRRPTFSPEVKGTIQLSQGNLCAKYVGNGRSWSYAISLPAFSPSLREMKVRQIKGEQVRIGVAPKSILEAGKEYSNCGWYVYTSDGSLYSQNGDSNKPFKQKIQEGSVITVKLDNEFNISFEVDGEDWGVVYPSVAKDYSIQLHLSISLCQPGGAVELLL